MPEIFWHFLFLNHYKTTKKLVTNISNMQIGATYLTITLKYVVANLFLSIPISFGRIFLSIKYPAKTQIQIAIIGIMMLFVR